MENILEQDNLVYQLNTNNFSAFILTSKKEIDIEHFLIPFSIKNKNQEFIIKGISENCFKENRSIKTITFPENSEIESFGDNAFSYSYLESISIPSKVKMIGKNCFDYCIHLKEVNFSDKSGLEFFDDGAFKRSAIMSICIPSKVKKISQYCFFFCIYLETVTFEKNSELEILGTNSFSNTLIKTVDIPPKVKTIEQRCFNQCLNLKSINFTENSELESICKDAFYGTPIETFRIPQKVTHIEDNCFGFSVNFERIEFDENSEIETFPKIINKTTKSVSIPSRIESFSPDWLKNAHSLISVDISPKNKLLKYLDDTKKLIVYKNDILLFACRDIKQAFIPSYIKRIGTSCFSHCKELQSIEIPEDSELQFIDPLAFEESTLFNKIFIPKNVQIIEQDVFKDCTNLQQVEFHKDSQLSMVNKGAFSSTSIENITFPSSIQILNDGWYIKSLKLKHITINENNKFFMSLKNKQEMIVSKSNVNTDVFDVLVFISNVINKHPFIPSFIKHINSDCFNGSKIIDSVDFEENSMLTSFTKNGFYESSIKSISIPAKVNYIPQNLFYFCDLLDSVEILCDDELNIEFNSFKFCSNLFLLSFPNANKAEINGSSGLFDKYDVVVFIKCYSKIEQIDIVNLSCFDNIDM